MRLSRKGHKDKRALSPVFASLILVAVTVIAGIIVYMYTSGYMATMMGGGTAGQEKVAIEAAGGDSATGLVSIWAKSTGGGDVVIQDAILKDASGKTIEVVTLAAAATLPSDGTLTTINVNYAVASMNAGYTYTVTLVSKEGNQFVSPAFKAS